MQTVWLLVQIADEWNNNLNVKKTAAMWDVFVRFCWGRVQHRRLLSRVLESAVDYHNFFVSKVGPNMVKGGIQTLPAICCRCCRAVCI